MKKSSSLINKGTGLILLFFGLYFTISDYPTISLFSLLFIAAGIVTFATEFIFNSDSPNDERTKQIKEKSGYVTYLLTLPIILLVILLIKYHIITDSLIGLYIILFSSIFLFPFTMYIINKKI